jgi:protein SCO1/2
MKNIEKTVGSQTTIPVKYLVVSIDPETDTPERLKAFAKENDMQGDQWVFLRGTEENTREFANVLAVKYAAISPLDFSHSNIISVFDRDGVMQHQMEGLAVNNEATLAAIRKYAEL